jgi:hypothetical protein
VDTSKQDTQISNPLLNKQSEIQVDTITKYAPILFNIARFFNTTAQSVEIVKTTARQYYQALQMNNYQKYQTELCFRAFYQTLQANFSNHKIDSIFTIFTKDEAFALIMHFTYQFQLKTIASACNVSIGTIQTRLDSAKNKYLLHSNSNYDEFIKSIQDTISEPLPEDLKSLKHETLFEKDGNKWKFNLTSAPWYYRIFFEGLLAATLVLSIVFSIPKIRKVYEFWVERRLDLYSLAEFTIDNNEPIEPSTKASENINTNNPESTPILNNSEKVQIQIPESTSPEGTSANTIMAETEFVGKDSERLSIDKIYRINILTDSPDSIRESVIKVLGTYEYQKANNNSLISDIPGGIMFDMFLPFSSYKTLVGQLSAFGETKVYITRSKEKGVMGKARVKIWIQRI